MRWITRSRAGAERRVLPQRRPGWRTRERTAPSGAAHREYTLLCPGVKRFAVCERV
jgi:hypothetical protein